MVRAVAYYLPQFHPIPENDEWWGKGFTEWTNVASARPRFRNHYQPHIPADLGFYDLRRPGVLQEQWQLAKDHSIGGFVFYHYWFGGRRVLDLIEKTLLEDPNDPSLPEFALCWANENWSRNWDGGQREVLIQQTYSWTDHVDHFEQLLPLFRHPKAIRVAGKPVFVVYRPQIIPNFDDVAGLWRKLAIRAGLGGLHIVGTNSYNDQIDPVRLGVGNAVDFFPNAHAAGSDGISGKRPLRRLPPAITKRVTGRLTNNVVSYHDVVDRSIMAMPAEGRQHLYPCVAPSWDNSPRRRQGALILHNPNAADYRRWLRAAVSIEKERRGHEGLVFINAWNEWAEGAHLEPDRRHGRDFLTATRDVMAAI